MNNPRCPKGRLATMVCVTQTCQRYAFMCTKCDDSLCQKGHQFCKTMLWSSALQRIYNYEKYQNAQFQDYIKRVDKIYDNIIKRVTGQRNLFRQNIEKILYDDKYQKIKHFIEKQDYKKVEPKDIGYLMTLMTSQNSNYRVQAFYLNQMKKLDSQITTLFQSIEKLYKKKLKATQNSISKDHNSIKSMTQSLVLKKQDKTKLSNSTIKKQNPSTTRILNSRTDLSYPQHIDSKIIPYATSLNYILGIKVKTYKLLYRASQNNFQIQQFYKKCIHSSSTIILAKTQHGRVVGGFTKLTWKRSQSNINQSFESNESLMKSKGSKYREDMRGSTLMFSVDLNQKYQLLQPKYAIYCGKNTIGFGRNDLRIINHANKHSKSLIGFPCSFNNGLYLPIQKSSLILSGSRHSSHFKIKQWQAFQVIFPTKK